jgi:TP901 family phage tail tape measure protein
MALKSSKVAIEVVIKDIKKIADLKKGLKELRAEQKKQEARSKTGQKQSHANAKAYKERAKSIKENSKELRTLNKDMAGANKRTKAVTKSSNGMAKQFIKGAAAIGVVVGAFRLINQVVSSVVMTFAEFEFVMAKVQAVSGATDSEFKQLTESAEELGRTTFFTAAQVGELQLAFSKLGFTASEIMDAQKATLDLATATGTDLARAAQVAGAAVRGFGLDASETERVVDVMAVSFASSAMDIEKWSTSMTKVAPIAKSAGFSIEDTAAMMSKLTDSGIEASIAGTSLRNILLKMQDPTSDLSMNFGKTIHSLDELIPAMKGFIADGGDMADILEVVDLRQAAAFEQMLTTADGTLALRDSLKEANGEGARMAGIVGDTLQGSFLKFTSAVQGVSISVMKGFSEGLQGAIENIASFFNVIAKNSKTIVSIIKGITTLAKWFGIYKLTLIAVTGLTIAYNKVLAIQRLMAIKAASGMTTLSAATMVAKRSINALMGSTGIGLLIVGLTELVPWLMSTNKELEIQRGLVDKAKDSYENSLKPIEELKIISENLIKTKKEMNKLLDSEGKLIDNSKFGQRVYNKFKGQAALAIKKLNSELKDNNQDLLTQKSSVLDVAAAVDILTKALTDKALVSGFNNQIEKLVEVQANAVVTKKRLEDYFNINLDATPFDNMSDAIAFQLSTMEEGFPGMANSMIPFEERMRSVNKILEDGGFTNFEQAITALEGKDDNIRIITEAFDELAGEGGIGGLILSLDKSKKGTGENIKTIKNWATETTDAINKVKKERFELGLTEEQYTAKVLSERLRLVKEERDAYVNGLGDKKANADKIVAFEQKLVELQLKIQANYFKEKKTALDDKNIAMINSIKNQYTVDGQITAQGQTALINQEISYLTAKGVLHDDYMVKIQGNNEKIAESNRKLHEQQKIEFQEQVSAYASVGSSLTTLAGDNEKLNAVKEAGNAISQAANIISTITTLKENLSTIAKVGNTGAVIANTVAEGANATATGVSTVMTLADTQANMVQIPFLATKSILKSGSSLPFPLNLIAIAATIAVISKVMKMFERGGIVDGGSKFAKGGVISKFADGGMVNGKSHAQGGEKFAVGGRVVELEGGEAVINKRSTAMYRGQLSQMNAAGGGVKFADGGMLNNPAFAQQKFSQGNNRSGSPQKVFVVEADISQSQNSVSVLEAAATI